MVSTSNRTKLIVLHGALGSSSQLEPLIQVLSDSFLVHTFDFSGHGGTTFPEKFSIATFARELDQWILQNDCKDALVFGYSMGGYAALQLLSEKADAFQALVTLGTKMDWTPESAAKEIKQLDASKILEKVPRFAEVLKRRHGEENWQQLLESTAQMMIDLGNGEALKPEQLATINVPVCIMRGDQDQMVGEVESLWAAKHIGAEFVEMSETPHPIEKVDPEKLRVFLDFWANKRSPG